MNIGFDFRMGGPQHAGIGRYTEELLFAMLEQDKVDTFFVFVNHSTKPETMARLDNYLNVEVISVPARHYSFAEQTIFYNVLRKLNLDVVHYPNFNHPVLDKHNFVVTVHDLVHDRLSGHKKSRLIYFYGYKYIMRHALQKAKVIITPCYASKDEIVTSYPETKEKVSVVYEGISLKQQPDSMVQKVKQQFLLNRPYFLFVGTLEKKKNTVLLARGFDRLIEKYNLDVDLVFAGKADMHYPEVRQQTLDIKNKSRLIFTGYLTDDQLAALYQGAHAYANASTNEGFGLPGVEAMQFGLPLVVSNTPVFNEVYDDAAVYFDPTNPDDIAEKLYLLATDKKFFESKQRAARSRSQYFSWDKAAAETLAILKNAGTGYQEIKIQKELEIETT